MPAVWGTKATARGDPLVARPGPASLGDSGRPDSAAIDPVCGGVLPRARPSGWSRGVGMVGTGVVCDGPSGRGGVGPDDAECRRRRGRACGHTANTFGGGPARPDVLGGAPPRRRPLLASGNVRPERPA